MTCLLGLETRAGAGPAALAVADTAHSRTRTLRTGSHGHCTLVATDTAHSRHSAAASSVAAATDQ